MYVLVPMTFYIDEKMSIIQSYDDTRVDIEANQPESGKIPILYFVVILTYFFIFCVLSPNDDETYFLLIL